MPMRALRPAIALAPLLLALALAGGCGGDSGDTPTSTGTPEVAATATAPAGTPAPDIREQNFAQLPAVSDFIATAGGEVATNLITYADLTEDGVDDAVVPISSGGEGGEIAVFVFGYGPDGLSELLRVIPESGFKDNVVDGKLTITEPVFAPGDPMCCPSQLRVTTYGWNGSELVIEDQRTEQTVQN
jgi:hypothetical protein